MEVSENVAATGNLYGYWQIAQDTWCITDHWQNFIYLLVGDERALLIDTGSGEGNLRKVVEEITDKPVMVVNTHGHFDHTGGNACWPDAWMTKEAAIHAKEPFGEPYSSWFCGKPFPDYRIHFIRGQDRIDLGGREAEIISIPAHSEGSIAVLDVKTRYLYAGDEIESGQVIWFVRNEAVPLARLAAGHKANMEKLLRRMGEYDFIWPAHNGAPLLPKPYLEDFIKLDEMIMEGTQETEANTAGFGFPADHHAVPNLFQNYGELLRTRHGLASVVYASGESAYSCAQRAKAKPD